MRCCAKDGNLWLQREKKIRIAMYRRSLDHCLPNIRKAGNFPKSKCGIPRTEHLVPERDGLGVWPDGRVLGTSPPPSPPPPSPPSPGKCPNMRKCTLFPKWTCLKFPEMLICQKRPLREHSNKGELFRT